MNCVFADSSFLVALVSSRDQYHDAAQERLRQWWGEVLTTEYVLLEVGNYLSRAADKPKFTHLVETILQDPAIRVIAATSELLNAGYDLYKRRLDKDWSLTDCISFVVMQREGLTGALTTDKHFEQAGFKKLLD